MPPFDFSFHRYVLVEQKDMLLTRITAAQRQAGKLGFPEPRFEWRGRPEPRALNVAESPPSFALKQRIEFQGRCLTFGNGWQVIAKIRHHKKGSDYRNDVVCLPVRDDKAEINTVFQALHRARPYCDIAKNARRRNITYLLRHQDSQERLQISEGQLDRFAGIRTKKRLSVYFDFYGSLLIETLWSAWDASYASGGRTPLWFPTLTFLAMAERLTDKKGFVKSAFENSTRADILACIHDPNSVTDAVLKQYVEHAFSPSAPLNDKAHRRAQAIVEHYRSLRVHSDFDASAQSLCGQEWVRLDHCGPLGVLASLPNAYRRSVLLPATSKVLNAHFGAVESRGRLKLKTIKCNAYPGERPSTYYLLSDSKGRVFRWRAASEPNEVMSVGCWVLMTGTIKAHSDYKGTKQTELTRCTDIVSALESCPVPDFCPDADKRLVKEHWHFELVDRNPAGEIDGNGYFRVERTWKEAGQVRGIERTLAMSSLTELTSTLETVIVDEGGVERTKSDHPVDRDFLAAADVFAQHALAALAKRKEWFLVEDAFHALGDHGAHERDLGYRGSAGDKHKLEPRLFVRRSDAERHGRQVPSGRLVSFVAPKTFRPLLLSDQARQREGLTKTLKLAGELGYHLVIFLRDNGSVSQCRPLGWTAEKWAQWGLSVTGMWPIHRPLDTHQKQLFLQMKFMSIVSASPARLAQIGEQLAGLSASGEQWEGYAIAQERTPTLASLAYVPMPARRVRLLLGMDPVAAYYVNKMGGDVARLDIEDKNIMVSRGADCPSLLMDSASWATHGVQGAVRHLMYQLAEDELYFRRPHAPLVVS